MSYAPRIRGPEFACELFKMLRGRWMDRNSIATELGAKRGTSDVWVSEYLEHGLIVERVRPVKPLRGIPAREYTLAPEWGGKA